MLGLAVAPKSNSVTRALSAGTELVRRAGNLDVPAHLRDAHYRGAATLGHGLTYDYPHDDPSGYVAHQRYLPDELAGTTLFEPSRHGHEAPVADRVAELRERARVAGRDRRHGDRSGRDATTDTDRPERT